MGCKKIEKNVCKPGAEVCKEVEVPKKVCGIKKKQKCIPVPQKKCEDALVEKCEKKPKKVCSSKTKRECWPVPTKVCEPVQVKKPRKVCVHEMKKATKESKW